jgi:hypothetical protein
MSMKGSSGFAIKMHKPVLSRIEGSKFLSIGGKPYALTTAKDGTAPEYSDITFRLLDKTQVKDSASYIGAFDTPNDFWLLLHEKGSQR